VSRNIWVRRSPNKSARPACCKQAEYALKKCFFCNKSQAVASLYLRGRIMILEYINSAGSAFVKFALPMLVQSSVLIAILLLAESLLRRKVRAIFRYWLGMLVLVQLILPPSQSSRVILGYLLSDKLGYLGNSWTAESAEVVSAITWQGVIFLLWLIVVVVMGLLLLERAIFASRLVKQAKEANGLMNDILQYCCKCMGARCGKVRLKISANGTNPTVCGLFRPVILVPYNLTPTLGSRHLREVLLHELAHIKRSDLWVNLAQTILQIIYFYNPFVWLANSMMRRVREQAVDEKVLEAMGEKARWYRQRLVDVARVAFKPPALGLGFMGLVESRSTLGTTHG